MSERVCRWCGEEISPQKNKHITTMSGDVYCTRYAGCRIEGQMRAKQAARIWKWYARHRGNHA